MKVKKLLNRKILGTSVLMGFSLFTFNTVVAQTKITIDANAEWVGTMNVYNNDTEQGYLWSSTWGLADLSAEKSVENNTLTLYPNYNTYVAGDEYWSVGEKGNKILEAFPHINDNSLVGKNVAFSGNVTSYTLSSDYTVKAYMKVMNVDGTNYTPIAESAIPITKAGNFTLTWDTAQYTTANYFEYGFIVKGINANPTTKTANGSVVITSGDAVVPEPPTSTTTVSIDTNSKLIAYANWFEADGVKFVNGGSWDVNSLKTVVNTTDNTMDLHPNFSAYTDEVTNRPTESTFHNGEIGNSVFEGNTYVQDDALAGQTFTYTGHTISNTLATGYEAIAFIKIFDANYGDLKMTTAPLEAGKDFNITATAAAGSHVQYGYSVKGLNANPTQEAALGYARVGKETTAGVITIAKKTPVVYPNPASNLVNVIAQDAIQNIDVYNMIGQKVITLKPNVNTTSINVSNLKAGVYTISTTVNGKTSASRFLKQ